MKRVSTIHHSRFLTNSYKKYGKMTIQSRKSVAQVVLRWLTQRGVIAVPKSVRKERIVV